MSKTVPLSNSSRIAIVDDEDFSVVSKFTWCLHGKGSYVYARGCCHGKKTLMHRLILQPDPRLFVDHANGDGLDNRRCNIRICTPSQNQFNSRPRGKTSKHKGVSWCNSEKKWRAFIRVNYKGKTIGRFDSEREAHESYKKESQRLFGEYAYVNNQRKVKGDKQWD